MPNEKTKKDYRKLAKHFYLTRIEGNPTPKKIKDALIKATSDYRPAYWRRLRNAICLDQREKGYRKTANLIAAFKNPLTTSAYMRDINKVPPKQKRVKKISRDDLAKIAQEFAKKRDPLLESALILMTILGCRPAELEGITILKNGLVKIIGAKKRATNDRGLDRLINLPGVQRTKVKYALQPFKDEVNKITSINLKSTIPHLLERRLATITKRVWPRRKHRPTLYSLRHQFGSDLKKTGLTREEIAYLIGHRVTKSADVYGNRKSGASRSIGAGVSEDEINKIITTNHHLPPRFSQESQSQPSPMQT